MKRALLAGFAVLLALALITCDAFPPVETSEDGKPELVTLPNGKQGVTLTIKAADTAGRSMTDIHAQKWTNYYEVVFVDGDGIIYRARWHGSETGRISVPFGEYAGVDPSSLDAASTPQTGVAIMLAGRQETDYSLLGVGDLTSTLAADGTPGTTTIDDTTVSVTFTLTPLMANVYADNDSAFQITDGPETSKLTSAFSSTPTVETVTATTITAIGTNSSGASTVNLSGTAGLAIGDYISFVASTGLPRYKITDIDDGVSVDITPSLSAGISATTLLQKVTLATGQFPQLKYVVNGNTESIPMFYVQSGPGLPTPGPTTNKATYTIDNGSGAFPHYKGVFIKGLKLSSTTFLDPEHPDWSTFTLEDVNGATGSKITLTLGNPMPSDGEIPLDLIVGSGERGLSWLGIDIAVRAMSEVGPIASVTPDLNGVLWHIRGGLINRDVDLGSDKLDDTGLPGGGQILLGTTDVKVTGTFEVIGTY